MRFDYAAALPVDATGRHSGCPGAARRGRARRPRGARAAPRGEAAGASVPSSTIAARARRSTSSCRGSPPSAGARAARRRRVHRPHRGLVGVVGTRRPPHPEAYNEEVRRSLLVLRLLTHEDTGGVVAAATTSLPEELGGSRNWDYRYVWLRDAALTLEALMHHGFTHEAQGWRQWLLRAIAGDPADVQIMYGLAGERRLPEWEVETLPGYRGAPVRDRQRGIRAVPGRHLRRGHDRARRRPARGPRRRRLLVVAAARLSARPNATSPPRI